MVLVRRNTLVTRDGVGSILQATLVNGQQMEYGPPAKTANFFRRLPATVFFVFQDSIERSKSQWAVTRPSKGLPSFTSPPPLRHVIRVIVFPLCLSGSRWFFCGGEGT